MPTLHPVPKSAAPTQEVEAGTVDQFATALHAQMCVVGIDGTQRTVYPQGVAEATLVGAGSSDGAHPPPGTPLHPDTAPGALDATGGPTGTGAGAAASTYHGLYAPRGSGPTSDGVALLWRHTLLSPSGPGEVLRYTDGQKLALLQPLTVGASGSDEGCSLLAATTHLHWNPCAPLQAVEAGELIARLQQVCVCLSVSVSCLQKGVDCVHGFM
jgi:hypothetical protein